MARGKEEFGAIVRRAGKLYNETPVDRGWGSPLELWRVGRKVWDQLILRDRKQRERVNQRQK